MVSFIFWGDCIGTGVFPWFLKVSPQELFEFFKQDPGPIWVTRALHWPCVNSLSRLLLPSLEPSPLTSKILENKSPPNFASFHSLSQQNLLAPSVCQELCWALGSWQWPRTTLHLLPSSERRPGTRNSETVRSCLWAPSSGFLPLPP